MLSVNTIKNTKIAKKVKQVFPAIKSEATQIKDIYKANKNGSGGGIKAVWKHTGTMSIAGALIGTLGFFIPIPGAQPVTMALGYFAGKRAEKSLVSAGSKLIKKLPEHLNKLEVYEKTQGLDKLV